MNRRIHLFAIGAVLILFASSTLACGLASVPSGATTLAPDSSPTVPPAQPSAIPGMAPGDHQESISADGLERKYILHVPVKYDGTKALPLVLVLHGSGGSAMNMLKLTQFNDQADQAGFFVAYLNGTGDPQAWTTGILLDLGTGVDDVAFVRMVLNQLEGELNVNRSRVYAAGFSNGALMTYRLGAELSDQFAAIAIVEGTIGARKPDGTLLTIPKPIGPIAVAIFHGKKDPLLPYDGGQGKETYALSVADAVSLWTQTDACTGTPEKKTLPTGNEITEYQNCSAGTQVVLFTLPNGVHNWPTQDGPAKLAGTDAIWKFFSLHPKAQ